MRRKTGPFIAAALVVLAAVLVVPSTMGQTGAPAKPATFDPQRTYAVETLRSDLDVLWDVLEEGHGGFDRYTSVEALKKSFEAAGQGISGPLTELAFYTRLLPLVAAIKDGHTQLTLSSGASTWLDGQPVFFPFEVRFLGGKVYLFRNLSAEPGVPDGAELLAIDGMPIGDIVAALLPLVPSDAGIRTARLRRLEHPASFGRLLALRYGLEASRRIRFRPVGGGEAREVPVACVTALTTVRTLRERYPVTAERRPLYELAFRGGTAVLTIRQFGDDPDKARPRYTEFLDESFRILAEKGARGLVIDLRGNGGGRDEYAKILFAHVMDRPFLYYWALETKKDRYDLFKYTDETPEGAAELARPLVPNSRGRFDVTGHPNRGIQATRPPLFAGKVAILVDGGSFSATGEVTSAFHYYKKAVFFGEECGSGYYGNTSGFMVTATLPATGIRIRVPLVLYQMAVDGYPKDRGIVPDFPVTPTIGDLLAGRDPVMDRALAYLEKN
ncbi:MAG: hypothetical protein KA243_08130 [Candidatus Aminicenantes bacterium]|nr:hypothetical protein [Candidatus Aminicenantes bacterium]